MAARSVVSVPKVCSWLIDFGVVPLADLAVEPGPRVQALRLARQRQAPLAEPLAQEPLVQTGEVADLADARREQVPLGDLADTRDPAHVERRQEPRLLTRQHPENTVRLGLIGADLGHHPRRGDADRAVQSGLAFHRRVQRVGRIEGLAVQAFGAGEVEVRLVDRRHLDARRERFEHTEDLVRVIAIARRVAVEKDGVWAAQIGRAQRHRRMNAELPGGVGSSRNHAALIRPPAHHHGLPLKRRVEQFLDGDEEGVHVDVKDRLHWFSP